MPDGCEPTLLPKAVSGAGGIGPPSPGEGPQFRGAKTKRRQTHGPRYVRLRHRKPPRPGRRLAHALANARLQVHPLLAKASEPAWLDGEALPRQGGTKPDFNCTTLRLTGEDLDRLEQAVRTGQLPETDGFFFGRSDGSETRDDLQFIATARTAIAAGETVYYTAWW